MEDRQNGVVVAQRIGDDEGKPANGFLIGAADAARVASRKLAQGIPGFLNRTNNPFSGIWIVIGDMAKDSEIIVSRFI